MVLRLTFDEKAFLLSHIEADLDAGSYTDPSPSTQTNRRLYISIGRKLRKDLEKGGNKA